MYLFISAPVFLIFRLVENIKTTSGSTFNDQGTKFIDTGGGFLIEEEEFCSESSGKVCMFLFSNEVGSHQRH